MSNGFLWNVHDVLKAHKADKTSCPLFIVRYELRYQATNLIFYNINITVMRNPFLFRSKCRWNSTLWKNCYLWLWLYCFAFRSIYYNWDTLYILPNNTCGCKKYIKSRYTCMNKSRRYSSALFQSKHKKFIAVSIRQQKFTKNGHKLTSKQPERNTVDGWHKAN